MELTFSLNLPSGLHGGASNVKAYIKGHVQQIHKNVPLKARGPMRTARSKLVTTWTEMNSKHMTFVVETNEGTTRRCVQYTEAVGKPHSQCDLPPISASVDDRQSVA